MARKYIYKPKEMIRRRAYFWEFHYNHRTRVKVSGFDTDRALRVISDLIPTPCIDGDGSVVEGMDTRKGKHSALDRLHLSLTLDNLDLMCAWYWSEPNWMDFVRLYQNLPDVNGDYYLYYDAARDAGLLLPVDNFGESRGKVGEFPHKSGKRVARIAV